jgi:hypothetical protein
MKREDDQQLWDLLGQAAQPEISPFFARNVIRRIRQQPRRFERVAAWFSPRKLIPAGSVAVALLVAGIVLHHPTQPQRQEESAPDIVAQVEPQDYDVVADLDELLASDENSPWDDNTTL